MILLQMSENALEGKSTYQENTSSKKCRNEMRRRNQSKIYLKKVSEKYVKYFLFDNIPYHLMEQIIIEFRCYEFVHKYDRQCNNICAGNQSYCSNK